MVNVPNLDKGEVLKSYAENKEFLDKRRLEYFIYEKHFV